MSSKTLRKTQSVNKHGSQIDEETAKWISKWLGEEGSEQRAKSDKFLNVMNFYFPLMLSNSYHEMNCWELFEKYYKKDAKPGNNSSLQRAALFLNQNQFYNLDIINRSLPHIEIADEEIKGIQRKFDCAFYPNDDQELKDYIFCKWLLVQLPFANALLHQWLTIVLIYVVGVQSKIIVQSYHSKRNPKLQKLHNLATDLVANVQVCFDWLQFEMENAEEEEALYDESKFEKPDKNLMASISQILASIEIFMSEKIENWLHASLRATRYTGCSGVVKLKDTQNHISDSNDLQYSWEHFCNMYMINFFEKGKLKWIFSKSEDEFEEFKAPISNTSNTEDNKGESEETMMPFLTRNMPLYCPCKTTAPAKEESCIDKLTLAVREELTFYYKRENYYKGICEAAKRMHKDGFGIYWKAIEAFADLESSILTSQMVRAVLEEVTSSSPGTYCFENENVEFYVMRDISLEEITPNKKRWQYDQILYDVRMDCESAEKALKGTIKRKKGSNDSSASQVKLMAKSFEVRLKRIVFNMIEAQYRTGKTQVTYYPERQFVQYYLPSCIAEFIAKLNQSDLNDKIQIANFIDQLIEKYEKSPIQISSCQTAEENCDFVSYLFQCDCTYSSFYDVKKYYTYIDLDRCDTNILKKIVKSIFNQHHKSYSFIESFEWPISWTMCTETFAMKCSEAYEKYKSKFNISTQAAGMNIFSHLACNYLDLNHAKYEFTQVSNLSTRNDSKTSFDFVLMLLDCLKAVKNDKTLNSDLENVFPLKFWSPIYNGLWCLLKNDRWKLKQIFSAWFNNSEREDRTLMSLDIAERSNERFNYALEMISDNKVKMSHPGEITFCPIKHCRWCGIVDCPEFRVCKECSEQEEYSDVNFFCSERCENEAMEELHLEEHARLLFELIRL